MYPNDGEIEFDIHLTDESVPIMDSVMRIATDPAPGESRAQRRRYRKESILQRRGAFENLPVHFSNDLVHGSWWFVLGSIIATLIPIVPLVDLFNPFWPTASSAPLPLFQDAATFGLLISSGVFFTLGSYAFVRATEEPPLKPLFSCYHFATDELLAAWLFLFGTLPFPAFMAVYVYYYSGVLLYWGCLGASLIFVIATYFFVLACYPSDEARVQLVPYIISCCCKEDCWVYKHLSNDWLAGTWIFFYGTLLLCVGSLAMLVLSLMEPNNSLEIFDWATSTLDGIIFLIGSAYFCAGSYPQDVRRNSFSAMRSDSKSFMHSGRESDPLIPPKNF